MDVLTAWDSAKERLVLAVMQDASPHAPSSQWRGGRWLTPKRSCLRPASDAATWVVPDGGVVTSVAGIFSGLSRVLPPLEFRFFGQLDHGINSGLHVVARVLNCDEIESGRQRHDQIDLRAL